MELIRRIGGVKGSERIPLVDQPVIGKPGQILCPIVFAQAVQRRLIGAEALLEKCPGARVIRQFEGVIPRLISESAAIARSWALPVCSASAPLISAARE